MRRLLLDTHVFLWWRSDDRRMSVGSRDAVSGADAVFVSSASAWEVAIKASLGKIQIPERFENGVIDSGFEPMLIRFAHAEAVAQLPQHHRDPFDRMLVAQAQVEGMTLVTRDEKLRPYEVEIIWA